MRSILRLVLFFIAFNVNVKVKAEVQESSVDSLVTELRQEPPGCFVSTEPCGFMPKSERPAKIELAHGSIYIASHAVLFRKSESHIRIVKGHIVVVANGDLVLETLYGNVNLTKGSTVLVELKSDRVQVTSIGGVAQLELLTKGEKLLLPTPYANWMGGVLRNGLSRSGRPVPGDFVNWIEKWGKLTNDKKLLKEKAENFRIEWNQALDSTGFRDLAAVKEYQSQLDEQRRQAALRRKRIREENARLRKMFIEKTFGEEILEN